MLRAITRHLTVIGAAVALVLIAAIAVAATVSVNLNTGDNAAVACPSTGKLTRHVTTPYQWTVKCRSTLSPSPTPTPTPSPTGGGGSYSCTAALGDSCGAYSDDSIPWSNGYDTYVSNQPVNVQGGGTETVNANSPGDWQLKANLPTCGGCVQTYPDIQQLTNDWGSGGPQTGSQDTPLADLNSLQIHYNETSPASGADYEFAADIWQDNYGDDVMFWVDTHGRCNDGAYGPSVLGQWTDPSGATWTVHRYDSQSNTSGDTGNEIMFVLNGAGGAGTCAQQPSGTIDVKAGLNWLEANGFESGAIDLSQVNTGWEITQADNSTFTVNDYSITTN